MTNLPKSDIENHIINHLINDNKYCRKIIPYLQVRYFEKEYGIVFRLIVDYVQTYAKLPTSDTLLLEIEQKNTLSKNNEYYQKALTIIQSLKTKTELDYDYLIDQTEKWCKEKALHNAIFDTIKIIDNKGTQSKEAIPEILREALSISFDPHIGHDYLEDYRDRLEFYSKNDEKTLRFDLEYFNKITAGGLCNKTLNVVMGGTGVGKTIFLSHVATSALLQNKNVLYLTMEMAEEKIAERIDANLMRINPLDLKHVNQEHYQENINKIKERTTGRLIIKEYPTGTPHVGHFRALLTELKLKKQFVPDVIFVDYINICSSSQMQSNNGSFGYIKAIAEELRGFAVENDVPILTATQINRDGYGSQDINLTNTAESIGLAYTVDLMFALIASEELTNANQIMVKQLKNRYNDENMDNKFIIGLNKGEMRFYDAPQNQQANIALSHHKEPIKTKEPTEYNQFKFN